MTDHPAIEAHGLTKRFGRARKPVQVLDGVDLSVGTGEVFALLGPNGAGKTTTVRILTTLLRPDGGRASVAGFDVVDDAVRVRERISLTGQHAAVDLKLSGAENLSLMGRLAHLSRHDVRMRVSELLEVFGLDDVAARRVADYSGGMRRRLDLAAGLLTRPEVMFLDEPTTGLDPRSRQSVWALIRDVVGDGTTLLLTTQYLEEADSLADRIALLDAGRITAAGTAAELKRQVGTAGVEVVFVETADAARAALALGLGDRFDDERAIRVPTDGSVGHVRSVLATLEATGLTPESWQLRAPTLDDVFLTLTGRIASSPHTGDSNENEAAA